MLTRTSLSRVLPVAIMSVKTARLSVAVFFFLFAGISLTTGCAGVSDKAAAVTAPVDTPTTPSAKFSANSTSLDFGNVPLNTTSAPQSVTLTNSGSSSVTVSSVSASDSAFNPSGVSAGLIVAPGQAATLNVTFTPINPGGATGNISVGTDIATASITVSGTSHAVTLTWVGSATTPGAPVTGYNVYRATSPDAFPTPLNSSLMTPLNSSLIPASTTQFTDTSVQPGQTYYYEVTTVGVLTLESDPSNQAPGSIPTN